MRFQTEETQEMGEMDEMQEMRGQELLWEDVYHMGNLLPPLVACMAIHKCTVRLQAMVRLQATHHLQAMARLQAMVHVSVMACLLLATACHLRATACHSKTTRARSEDMGLHQICRPPSIAEGKVMMVKVVETFLLEILFLLMAMAKVAAMVATMGKKDQVIVAMDEGEGRHALAIVLGCPPHRRTCGKRVNGDARDMSISSQLVR
jgi:adenosine/AMP kinase